MKSFRIESAISFYAMGGAATSYEEERLWMGGLSATLTAISAKFITPQFYPQVMCSALSSSYTINAGNVYD
ncbi:hypothetical protein L6452_27243 [Arctium lappa]|uniref:Uncharacterized protein n=1 Tax=Arctium lappa TaxID=4217 RepID=A0ACB8ZWV7_ARCLA|nr:hypothetical protein L6452_27243 [Arctium lappa]